MVGHCYASGSTVAAFMLVLILFMMILFLRFTTGKNIILVFTPLACAFDLPVLLPVGCGLLSNVLSALPAAGGVIIFYLSDFPGAVPGLQGQIWRSLTGSRSCRTALWGTGNVAYSDCLCGVVIVVNIIRTRTFDYAWRLPLWRRVWSTL